MKDIRKMGDDLRDEHMAKRKERQTLFSISSRSSVGKALLQQRDLQQTLERNIGSLPAL